ncbi:hypothetical protein [Palleronia abyssalis]|uniref:PAS fold-4 domain-containing protein n=1 Tax=Palleronia abyssalis TaxID=1501240 RepID=A0A2R8BXR2_9RHOB|nr:hypothetical protein [Palleronia abyssalis]SPJ24951.1 hypothetical protein PAA8504_02793 [Palleronia abyssalis]
MLPSRLTELCAAFRCCDAQLRVAIQSDGASGHARLLRKSVELLSEIERYQPKSTEEMEELLDFFARRRVDEPTSRFEDIEKLAQTLFRTPTSSLPQSVPGGLRQVPVPDPLPQGLAGPALASLVVCADDRMVALDRGYRILAVSQAEARYRRATAGHLAGKHLLEVIGCGTAQLREKNRIDLAFAGQPQSREIEAPEHHGAGPLMKRIDAVTDKAGRCYAVAIRTTPVAEDQRSAGTT